ncbi:MAG: hypothetical protein HWN67_19085 [Candidatus Helarchaeota archaeon]|nr:hypothetical protein [Candidatus Helarchaeota archaeon]
MSLEQKIKEKQKMILEQQKTILHQNGVIEKQQELIIEQKNQINDLKKELEVKGREKTSRGSATETHLSNEAQLKKIEDLEQKLKNQEVEHEKGMKQVIKDKFLAIQKLQRQIEKAGMKDWEKIVNEKEKIINDQEQKLNAVRVHVEKLKGEWAEKETFIEKLEKESNKLKELEKSQEYILETEGRLKKMEEVWKQKIKEKDNRIKELEKMLDQK